MIEKGKSLLSFFARHPLLVFVLGALVLSVAAIVVLGGDDAPSPPPPEIEKTEEGERAYGGNIFKSESGKEVLRKNRGRASSSYDDDPEKKAEEIERHESRPVLQMLPYYDTGVAFDIVSITPDGTPVVEIVRPDLASEEFAQKLWENFVESNGDSLDNYVVVHRKV